MNEKNDFWTLVAAKAVIKAVNAAHAGDAKKLDQANASINQAFKKIRKKRKEMV